MGQQRPLLCCHLFFSNSYLDKYKLQTSPGFLIGSSKLMVNMPPLDHHYHSFGPFSYTFWLPFSLSLFQCLAVYVLYRLSMEKKMKARLSPIVIFLVILLFELSLSFCNFINSTAYSTWADASLHLFLHKSCMVYLSLSHFVSYPTQ